MQYRPEEVELEAAGALVAVGHRHEEGRQRRRDGREVDQLPPAKSIMHAVCNIQHALYMHYYALCELAGAMVARLISCPTLRHVVLHTL